MMYIPDAYLDQLLLEDIQYGDITTRALGIGQGEGEITFFHRQGGCVSGLPVAERLLQRLGLRVTYSVQEGERVQPDEAILSATGKVAALHQGWKVTQNVLEWCCGVSEYLYQMKAIYTREVPSGQIACTRKIIPGTKPLSVLAVLAGGGIVHRLGCAETILLFTNHRRFLPHQDDWASHIAQLRHAAPEKAVIVEVDHPDEAIQALNAGPDILQLDKFTPEQVASTLAYAARYAPACKVSAAGGINLKTVQRYAETGVSLLVTSAPYHAPSADVRVVLTPIF
ncbi:ModD protein [Pectobacterium wasabiae]|uniref:Putative pyrophosphorylase ModD n=1 Tax=Pectobacterium wasabiae TaxID=55208 RepID=A0AAW3ECF9_9GAMM|nr:ModD protein [Pectobacterium wasabiae]AOR63466.1 ModD protein [Pectobacterium wasabiae CFBP 3304]EJS92768.1 ModD [Pectobacterium wasabiae CFBP 3304]KFX03213.1 molybdenum transport protein ModD [Pectobacterium wasabiae]KGA26901.1 molybdenum transport protein ModD [Pectobacterium wasabiae]